MQRVASTPRTDDAKAMHGSTLSPSIDSRTGPSVVPRVAVPVVCVNATLRVYHVPGRESYQPLRHAIISFRCLPQHVHCLTHHIVWVRDHLQQMFYRPIKYDVMLRIIMVDSTKPSV